MCEFAMQCYLTHEYDDLTPKTTHKQAACSMKTVVKYCCCLLYVSLSPQQQSRSMDAVHDQARRRCQPVANLEARCAYAFRHH